MMIPRGFFLDSRLSYAVDGLKVEFYNNETTLKVGALVTSGTARFWVDDKNIVFRHLVIDHLEDVVCGNIRGLSDKKVMIGTGDLSQKKEIRFQGGTLKIYNKSETHYDDL
jgi:hypothetical protein